MHKCINIAMSTLEENTLQVIEHCFINNDACEDSLEFTFKDKLIMDLCIEHKSINDALYGSISLTKFAVEIIDTVPFQRMRKLSQLGSCNYVFQNAVHTRFDHSIGTYALCKELTSNLASNTNKFQMNKYLREIPQLETYIRENYNNKICEFDDYLQELVNIAAICHDLGHGAFSHIFDDEFVNKTYLKDHPNSIHEVRSGLILENIISNSSLLSNYIHKDHIDFIKLIIDPTVNCKGFIYQIVSNNINSLDVDKLDYITRDTYVLGIKSSFDYKRLIAHALVINNNIAYPEQCVFDIYDLFNTRYRMHKQVYAHQGVIAAQLMLTDMMTGMTPIINIAESILNMNEFCKITDTYVMECLNFTHLMDPLLKSNEQVVNATNILNRLKTHDLYCSVAKLVTKDKLTLDKNIIFSKFPDSLKDVIIFQSTIGYVSGNKSNPLDNIFVYKTKNKNEGIPLSATKKNKQNISFLVGDTYQEHLNIVFYKKTDEHSKLVTIPTLKNVFLDYIEKNTLLEYVEKNVFLDRK